MHFLETDVVEILNISIRNHANVYALIKTDSSFCFGILLEKVMLLAASRDIWVKHFNVVFPYIRPPKIRDIRNLYGTAPLFCGNI